MLTVGHAFGAPHTTGIMARGYARDWPMAFLPQTAYSPRTHVSGSVGLSGDAAHEARWDLRDALSFSVLPHFKLPGDKTLEPSVLTAFPSVKVKFNVAGD